VEPRQRVLASARTTFALSEGVWGVRR